MSRSGNSKESRDFGRYSPLPAWPVEEVFMQAFRLTVFAIAFAALGATAIAQVESTPVPLQRKPDFSNFMTGTFTCSVRSSRRPGPYVTTNTSSVDSSGQWLVTRTTVHKASWIPQTFSGEDRITYDPSTSRWIDLTYDATGGYNVATSPGWRGNTMVWTDAVVQKSGNVASTTPTTWTRVSAAKVTQSTSFREAGGRVVTVKTVCTK